MKLNTKFTILLVTFTVVTLAISGTIFASFTAFADFSKRKHDHGILSFRNRFLFFGYFGGFA